MSWPHESFRRPFQVFAYKPWPGQIARGGVVVRLWALPAAVLIAIVGWTESTLADNRALYEVLLTKEEIAFGDQCFDLMRQHDFSTLEAKLAPELRGPTTRETLERIAAFIPSDAPLDSDIIRTRVTTVNGKRMVDLTFQYLFPQIWVVEDITIDETGRDPILKGFLIDASLQSVEQRNSLSPSIAIHKPIKTLLIGGLAVAVPAFCLITAFFCLRTPIPRRKWLWTIFVLLGFTELSVDWITGKVDFQLLVITILGGASSHDGTYGGWMFAMSLPVGAVIFWIKRIGWLEDHRAMMDRVELEMQKEEF